VRKLPRLIEINFHKLRRELWGKSTEVAQVLGIAPQSLSRKLQEHHKLTLDELNRIALYLGKDASDFLLFKESTQLDGANYPEEVIMDAMNVAQNIRQFVKEFKESISSTFGQIMENKSEAERIEIIKALDEIMESLQNSGSKVAISLDQLLENRSEAERAAIVKVFGDIPQDCTASGLEEKSGFTHLTIDEIVLLSDNGVEIEWLKALRELGFTHLTADEIVRLSDNGVEIEWLKGIRELGLIGEHTDGDHHGDDHDDSHDDDHDSDHSNQHRS
jgi:transcriptional regulator with XRE-family HTH domain